MCGISAIVAADSSPRHAQALQRMHAPIRHRGPDDERAVIIEGGSARLIQPGQLDEAPSFSAGMAFRRLKIVDVSEASAQPMASRDGRRWLVFNGEIYNFRELARELSACGHSFTSHGDAEVLLAAYEEWGIACFQRLEGMWAVVIIDLERRRVIASRDRFGIKPLYYAIDGTRVLFASEIKQLLPVVSGLSLDRTMALAHLAGVRYPVTRESFWLGVEHIAPATVMELELDEPARPARVSAYWVLDDFTARGARSYKEACGELRATLADAVSSHSLADVRLGSLLSGGLDSAVLTGLLHQKRGATFPTYSFGFRDAAPEACELPVVDEVVRMKGLENHETTFDEAWIIENAERAVRAMEEPPMALAAIAQFRTFELVARQGTTVVLDGQGADEIFAGYPYHERDFLLDRLRHGRLGEFSRGLRAIGRKNHRSRASLILHGLIAPALAGLRNRYPFLASAAGDGNSRFERSHDSSRVNRRLHFDIERGNVRIVLGLGDRNSMAHSIESRVPYFDRRVVELAFSLPDDFKIGEGDRKRILRDLGREMLPRTLTDAPARMGYGVPLERFLRRGLRPWVEALVSDSRFSGSSLFGDGQAMVRFVGDYFAGRNRDAGAVWRLAALAVWQNTFDVDLR